MQVSVPIPQPLPVPSSSLPALPSAGHRSLCNLPSHVLPPPARTVSACTLPCRLCRWSTQHSACCSLHNRGSGRLTCCALTAQRGRHRRRSEEAGRRADRHSTREDPYPKVVHAWPPILPCTICMCMTADLPLSAAWDGTYVEQLLRCVNRAQALATTPIPAWVDNGAMLRSVEHRQCGRYTVYKDHITLEDYEIHDGMGLELYYN